MFTLKQGVNPNGVQKEIWYAIGVASEVYAALGATLVVTSLTDGQHNTGSLHTKGLAVDLRVNNLADSEKTHAMMSLQNILDHMGYDVVWEGGVGATPMTTGAHIHIEFDPKSGEKFLCYI